jgi:hypothetical protein
LLNNIVAFSNHGVEQAVAINLANSVAIAIFSVCSALSQPLDYPHLIIIYHFVLLIMFSGITHSTVHPRLGKSSRFGPLMEHLAILDLCVMPFFIMISGTLWLGIWFGRAVPKCTLGNWVLFGKEVDLKTGNLYLVGEASAALLVGCNIAAAFLDMIVRQATVSRVTRLAEIVYCHDNPSVPRTLPPGANIDAIATGNFCSAMLSRIAVRTIDRRLKAFNKAVGVREIVFAWRFLVWLYLVVSNEQILVANNLAEEEDTLTYGQIYPLLLLVVPIGVLWADCYRKYPKLSEFLNSTKHRLFPYANGVLLSLSFFWVIYTLNPIASLQQSAVSIVIFCCLLPVYVRSRSSRRVNEAFGDVGSSSSSYWEVWTDHLRVRVPLVSSPGASAVTQTEDSEENTELTALPVLYAKRMSHVNSDL